MVKLDGRALSLERREQLKSQIQDWVEESGVQPCLAVVLVGEDPASQVYVSHKIKACEATGIKSVEKKLPSSTTQDELEAVVDSLNKDPHVHGILVQLPLPDHLSEAAIIDKIDPLKDADGLVVENLGLLAAGRMRVAPCTPDGVIQMLKKYQIPMSGKNAVVVGRSQIVGKPMALLLLQENATVTICHSKTVNLKEHLASADIVVVAAGRPEFLGKEDFREGTAIVDVGIHRKSDGRLCGDVRYDELVDSAAALSPVPGGVGPMTIAMLLENTLQLTKLQNQGKTHE